MVKQLAPIRTKNKIVSSINYDKDVQLILTIAITRAVQRCITVYKRRAQAVTVPGDDPLVGGGGGKWFYVTYSSSASTSKHMIADWIQKSAPV